MKKISVIIFAGLFLAICLFPALTLGHSSDAGQSEKAESNTFPKLVENKTVNTSFFSEFDTWVTRNMGFRSSFIDANAHLRAILFSESSEDDVIVGSGGWLYYADTVKDYENEATLSVRNANNIAAALKMMQDYCEQNGAKFVFTVAPNKNTVYGANMPDRYTVSDGEDNLALLTGALSVRGVNYADLVEAISKEPEVLYQKRDSHWTYRGALVAYRAVVKELETGADLFPNLTFSVRHDWDADLVNMLYTDAEDTDEQKYPDIEFTYETKGVVTSSEALTITAYGNGEGKLLMFRDSFGNTMWPYFAETTGESEFSRVVPYRLDRVVTDGFTEVVLEIVERNLENLAERAPVMEAPETELYDVLAADLSDYGETGYRKPEYGMLHVYGTVPEEILGEDYEVILITKTGNSVKRYLAFPIYEKELLGSDTLGDNGYSAYLPTEAVGASEMSIVVISNGVTYTDNSVNWVTVSE